MPNIYARSEPPARLDRNARFVAGVIAAACLALLVTAAAIEPSRSGFGSHTQLHMAPCQFLQRTGLPCPGCGMTTSFAWFVRGNLVASAWVQPFGMILAIVAAMTFWTALYVAVAGRPVYRLLGIVPIRYYAVPLAVLFFAGWGWKMFIHLHGMDGW